MVPVWTRETGASHFPLSTSLLDHNMDLTQVCLCLHCSLEYNDPTDTESISLQLNKSLEELRCVVN